MCIDQVHISLRKDFDNSIREIFWPYISPYDFPDVNLEDTPLYDMYEDDTTDVEGSLEDKSEVDEIPVTAAGLDRHVPTTESNENYVNSSAMLSIWNTYAIGKVV